MTKNRVKSFEFAFSGLLHTFSTQTNFQIQLFIGLIAVLGAIYFGFTRLEWLILIITIALVLTAEIINTVIEVVVDLAVKERLLPDAKIAKDVSAAAVLLMSVFSVIVGLILFLPYVLLN
jgi:diacylglycerol kinase